MLFCSVGLSNRDCVGPAAETTTINPPAHTHAYVATSLPNSRVRRSTVVELSVHGDVGAVGAGRLAHAKEV